ncbi:transglycosylase domain-containing protein [Helicobacter saguini]|nr:transglycosylase domain-containing protein [Helicobacter saguini]
MNATRYRRKMAEILFSRLWLDRIIGKDEQLEIYLSSINFAQNVNGVIQAIRYFYGNNHINLTKAQSFVLAERVAMIVSNELRPRIVVLLKELKELKNDNTLSEQDIKEVTTIYNNLIKQGKVKNNEKIIKEMKNI